MSEEVSDGKEEEGVDSEGGEEEDTGDMGEKEAEMGRESPERAFEEETERDCFKGKRGVIRGPLSGRREERERKGEEEERDLRKVEVADETVSLSSLLLGFLP
jgi:hypothetical protein